MSDLNARAAAYWAELNAPTHISTSHHTLRALVQDFGQSAVYAALAQFIAAERAARARIDAERVRQYVKQYEKQGSTRGEK
jgi:hypothetical protein